MHYDWQLTRSVYQVNCFEKGKGNDVISPRGTAIDVGELSFCTKQTWRDSRAKEFIVASLLGVPWSLMLASQDIGNWWQNNSLRRCFLHFPPQPIHSNSVAYHRNYYFDQVLDTTDDYVQFTFLERVGESMYHWPRRDDIETGHLSNLFFGPVTILIFISGPFPFPKEQVVKKILKAMKKYSRANKKWQFLKNLLEIKKM